MRSYFRLALVLVILLTTFGAASAQTPGTLIDTWLDETVGTNNPTSPQLLVMDQTNSCATEIQYVYFQFSVSQFQTVNSVSLQLTHASTIAGVENSPALSLYGTNDVDLAAMTPANNPTPSGTPLASVTIPPSTSALTKITFSSPELTQYVQQQANGDNTVTLIMSFSGNCSAITTQLNFYSMDYTGDATRKPALTVLGTPLAVSLSNAEAQQQPNAWPFYAGIAAVALLVVAGVTISRRRTA